jgi:hypothetical protein
LRGEGRRWGLLQSAQHTHTQTLSFIWREKGVNTVWRT